jgi:hypothetical protein
MLLLNKETNTGEEKSDIKIDLKNFTYGKQSKRPLRFYGGAIFLSCIASILSSNLVWPSYG